MLQQQEINILVCQQGGSCGTDIQPAIKTLHHKRSNVIPQVIYAFPVGFAGAVAEA